MKAAAKGEPGPEELMELIEKYVDLLMEHFSTVRIFATLENRCGDGSTERFSSGAGNFYAQVGQVRLWAKQIELEETSSETDIGDGDDDGD